MVHNASTVREKRLLGFSGRIDSRPGLPEGQEQLPAWIPQRMQGLLWGLGFSRMVAGEETALKAGWFNQRSSDGLAKLAPISFERLACLHDIDEVVLFDHETQEAANRLCLFVVEHLNLSSSQSRSFLFSDNVSE